MMRIFIVIITLCGVAPALVKNEWIKVKNPLDSKPYREFHSKTNTFLNRRITGGQVAELEQFKYQALLKFKVDSRSSTYLCGGTIIAKNWILTAAHCVDGKISGKVIVGIVDWVDPATNGWILKVNQEDLIVHEKYDVLNFTNDIGLIRLATEIPKYPTVYFIILPLRAESNGYLDGKTGTVSGFGRQSDNSSIKGTLRWVEVTIIQNEVCEKSYENVISSNVCVETNGGKSACSGDSGGPLTVLRLDGRSELAGIVSYGKTVGCEKGYPSVFTRVHSFLDWIGNKTGIQIL